MLSLDAFSRAQTRWAAGLPQTLTPAAIGRGVLLLRAGRRGKRREKEGEGRERKARGIDSSLSNDTGKLLWFEITKMLIAV